MILSDCIEPVEYRVYPETPFLEVVDLMVRRALHAVPVVGRDYEVLGIITSGDALSTMLPRFRAAGGVPAGATGPGGALADPDLESLTAREVMTRTVLCVSENESLLEAATMMTNRDVEQLPVVREGRLVGFVTRDVVLRTLHASQD